MSHKRGHNGTPMRSLPREALKPKPEPTAAQLLACAGLALKRAQAAAAKQRQADAVDQENRRNQP